MNINKSTIETMGGKMEKMEAASGRYRAFRMHSSKKWSLWNGDNLAGEAESEADAEKWIIETATKAKKDASAL